MQAPQAPKQVQNNLLAKNAKNLIIEKYSVYAFWIQIYDLLRELKYFLVTCQLILLHITYLAKLHYSFTNIYK